MMRKQRVDVLIWILSEKAEPDYRRDELSIRLGFTPRRLCKEEMRRKKCADEIPMFQASAMVMETASDTVQFNPFFVHMANKFKADVRLSIARYMFNPSPTTLFNTKLPLPRIVMWFQSSIAPAFHGSTAT